MLAEVPTEVKRVDCSLAGERIPRDQDIANSVEPDESASEDVVVVSQFLEFDKPDHLMVEAFPQDKGWSWVCVAASLCMEIFVLGICVKSFGLLSLEIQDVYNTTKAEVSWMLSICACIMLLLGPFTSLLTDRFGTRVVIFIGGLLLSIGFIASAFATTIYHLYFTYGVITGVGGALVYTPGLVFLSQHFTKYRASVNGLSFAGSGVGSFFISPLVTKWHREQGLRFTLIVLGALMLNVCALSCLYRPASFYAPRYRMKMSQKKREQAFQVKMKHKLGKEHNETESENTKIECNNYEIDNNGYIEDDVGDKKEHGDKGTSPETRGTKIDVSSDKNDNLEDTHLYEKQYDSIKMNSEMISEESIRSRLKNGFSEAGENNGNLIHSKGEMPRAEHIKYKEKNNFFEFLIRKLFGSLKKNKNEKIQNNNEYDKKTKIDVEIVVGNKDDRLIDEEVDQSLRRHNEANSIPIVIFETTSAKWRHVLTNRTVLELCIGSAVLFVTYTSIFTIAPNAADDYGMAKEKGSNLVSLLGLVDTVTGVLVGIMGDSNIISKKSLCTLCTLFGAILFALAPLCNTFWTMTAVLLPCAVTGICYVILVPVIMSERIGVHLLGISFGMANLFSGVSFLCWPVFLGWLRDHTENYTASYLLCSVLNATVFLVSFSMWLISARRRRRERGRSSEGETSKDDDHDDQEDRKSYSTDL